MADHKMTPDEEAAMTRALHRSVTILPDCMMPDGDAPCAGYAALRAERDRAIEREAVKDAAIRSLLAAQNCPNCPDQGWYETRDRRTGDPAQEQCQFCDQGYDENTPSVYMAKQRAQAALSNSGTGLIEALREIAAIVPDEPMACIIELSRIRDIAKRALAGVGLGR